jgi:hypothetical protein
LLQSAKNNDRHGVLELLHAMGLGFKGTVPLTKAAAAGASARPIVAFPPFAASGETLHESTL